jgi:hypothetical protein
MMSILSSIVLLCAATLGEWPRHVIDQTSQGADGVRCADVNKDDLLDIVTGWEEGGDVRIAVNPGAEDAAEEWPSFSVGRAADPEDAVMVDLDGDGWLDVVSCTEGGDRNVYVHWNPGDESGMSWKMQQVPQLAGQSAWMFCLPLAIVPHNQTDLVFGSKNPNGRIGWLETSASPRDLSTWRWHDLRTSGWIMSLLSEDMDDDGDQDILLSDRKGPATGVYWLEQTNDLNTWPEHEVGARGREVMFITTGDIDNDGDRDIAAAVKPRDVVLYVRRDTQNSRWNAETVTFSESFGTSKAVRIADIDSDGKQDLVVTCEDAKNVSGVFWLSRNADGTWEEHDIAGALGTKYDLIELLDLDGDGDLDVITCEEREINAVIWYENPMYSPGASSQEEIQPEP